MRLRAFLRLLPGLLVFAHSTIGIWSASSSNSICAFAEESTSDVSGSTEAIYADVRTLVSQFYPKAKITTSPSDNALHFEYKLKSEVAFYSQQPVRVPGDGGILGDIALKPGPYEGKDKDRLPVEDNDGFHTNLVMAPYSKKSNSHLLAKLTFPTDMPLDFKIRFKQLIDRYNSGEREADRSQADSSANPSKSTTSTLANLAKVASESKNPPQISSASLKAALQSLDDKIQAAKQNGVGTSVYEAESRSIAEAAAKGDSEDSLQERIRKVSDGIQQQIDNARTRQAQGVGSGQGSAQGSNQSAQGAAPQAVHGALLKGGDPRAARLAQALVTYGMHNEYTIRLIASIFGTVPLRGSGPHITDAFNIVKDLGDQLQALKSDINIEYGKGFLAVFRDPSEQQLAAARRRNPHVTPYEIRDVVKLCTFE